MLNPAYAADALAGFNEIPARGPYTLANANSALYVSLPNVTANYTSIVTKIRNMVSDGSFVGYLPPDYRVEPAMVAGYKHSFLCWPISIPTQRHPASRYRGQRALLRGSSSSTL